MEGLRLFDIEAFRWLRSNRELLLREGQFSYANTETIGEELKVLEQLIPEAERSQVWELLEVLFPQIRRPGQVASFFSESHGGVMRRRGIGCAAGYDTFFSLYPSEDAIPMATLRAVLSEGQDEEDCENILRRLITIMDSEGIPLICALLEELSARYQGIQESRPRVPVFRALFKVGEEILKIDGSRRRLMLMPRSQLMFLIRDMVKAWGEEEGGRQMIEVFRNASSVAMLSDVYVDRGREFGVFQASGRDEPIIARQVFEDIGELLKEKIESAYDDGVLEEAPNYFDIARSWSYLAGDGRAREWLSYGAARNARFMAKVAIGLLAYSEGPQGRHYRMHEKPTAEFYDLEALLQAATRHQGDQSLTEDERRRVVAVAEGLKLIVEQTGSG